MSTECSECDTSLAKDLFATLLQEINTVLRVLAVPTMHPTMVHCTHGKDRTGITMALVGRLLGLDDATIIADYHMSDAHGSSDEGRATFAHVPELVRCGRASPRGWLYSGGQSL